MPIELRGNYFSIRYERDGKNYRIANKEWDKRNGVKKSMIKRIMQNEIIKDIERRKEVAEEANKVTISKSAYLFLDTNELSTKGSTNVSKTAKMNNYVIPFFGAEKTPKEAINVQAITRFVLYIGNNDRAKAPETKNHIMQLFREYLDFLAVQNLIEPQTAIAGKSICKPFTRAGYHKANEHNYLTPEEYDTLISTFSKDDIMYYVIDVSYWGALRIGETLGLKFSDFDFRNHTLTISRQVNKDLHDRITTPKTDSSCATIAIRTDVCDEVLEYMKEGMFSEDDYLFYKRISRTDISRKLKSHLKLAGITHNVSMHGLRHSMGSRLINSGKFAITQSSKQLRHSSSAVTLSTYAHEFERIEANDIDKL